MSKPDLILRPGDWMLGLWWAEMPGGHRWWAWARLDHPGDHTSFPVWHVWIHSRTPGEPYLATMNVEHVPQQTVEITLNRAKRDLMALRSPSRGGWIDVYGGGPDLVERFEKGASFPDWLHVLVIEERAVVREQP